jgi:guanine deaminase
VVGLEDKLGNFLPGKYFDAIVVDPFVPNSPFDVFPVDDTPQIFEKFLFLGDDRNITQVYVQGRQVVPFQNNQE